MPFWFEVALAASGASDQGLRVFIAVSMTISAAGDSFAARADLCHQYSLSPVSTPVSLIPVRNNQKAKNLSLVSSIPLKNCLPVSTTPLINFSPVSVTPAIRESCQY